MQRCQNAQNVMESNGVGTYLDGWWMSIATQRAKERENRTPDVKVMTEMVKELWLAGGGPCARGLGPVCTGSRAHGTRAVCTGCPETLRGPVGTGSGARVHGGGGNCAI
jgi:hypothetical protein